jgi:hypothetical protein
MSRAASNRTKCSQCVHNRVWAGDLDGLERETKIGTQIGEHSLAASANEPDGMRSPIVTVKRRADLGIDLATALIDLRLRLPPGIGTRSLTNF